MLCAWLPLWLSKYIKQASLFTSLATTNSVTDSSEPFHDTDAFSFGSKHVREKHFNSSDVIPPDGFAMSSQPLSLQREKPKLAIGAISQILDRTKNVEVSALSRASFLNKVDGPFNNSAPLAYTMPPEVVGEVGRPLLAYIIKGSRPGIRKILP